MRSFWRWLFYNRHGEPYEPLLVFFTAGVVVPIVLLCWFAVALSILAMWEKCCG